MNTCGRVSNTNWKQTQTNMVDYCSQAHTQQENKSRHLAEQHTHTHSKQYSECVLITGSSARDAPAQRASGQTLSTDHRQAGQCFILAREHYRLITLPQCFEARARLVYISLFLAEYEWEGGLWWTEPEALVWYWLCKVDPKTNQWTSPLKTACKLICQQAGVLLHSRLTCVTLFPKSSLLLMEGNFWMKLQEQTLLKWDNERRIY